jgi:signal transduction histidine kinase
LQVALADPNASAETLRATCEELLLVGRDQERLIEALLTLASSERGLELRERVDIGALAQQVLERPRAEFQQYQIELDARLEAAVTDGDPALIERLISNLVDNAVRHNVAGGRVEISTRQQGDQALLVVENTGQLIAPEEIETMFEPFRRLGPARTGSDAGQHGLGLSIVRAIASAHGAEAIARPRPGGGLTVTVAFPAPPAEITSA